ncbi:MAG: hypothetical protein P1V81_11170 [Planctomycetota bacterium]|nr:hypothetical protein [Planctomycetota bacterium]
MHPSLFFACLSFGAALLVGSAPGPDVPPTADEPEAMPATAGPGPPTVAPTPPPYRFDPGHRAWLDAQFGPLEPTDPVPIPPLGSQPQAVRPLAWLTFDSEGEDFAQGAAFARAHLGAGEQALFASGGSRASLPASGELAGSFAFARTTIEVPAAEVRFARAPGVAALLVNGQPFAGDPYRRGHSGVPVPLREGTNELWVLGVQGGFELELWKPMTRMVLLPEGCTSRSNDLFVDTSVAVANAALEPASYLHFHPGPPRPQSWAGRWGTEEWHDGWVVPALGLVPIAGVDMDQGYDDAVAAAQGDEPWFATVEVFAADDDVPDRALVQARRAGSSSPAAPDPAPKVDATWAGLGDAGSLLLFETGASAELDAAVQDAARFSQQLLWARTGRLSRLLEATEPALDEAQKVLERGGSVLTFGSAPGAGPGELLVKPTSGTTRGAEVRGADAGAFAQLLLVDPLFREPGQGGRRWRGGAQVEEPGTAPSADPTPRSGAKSDD